MYRYFMENRRIILKYIMGNKVKCIILIGMNLINTLFSLILPILNMNLINLFVYGRIKDKQMYYISIYIITLVVSMLSSFCFAIYKRRMDLEMQKEIQILVLSKKMKKSTSSFKVNENGEVDALVKFDVPIFQQYIIQIIVELPVAVFRVIGVMFLLTYLSIEFALLVIALETIIFLFQHYVGKKIEIQSMKVREKFSFWNELVSNIINSMKYAKYIGSEVYLKQKYENTYNQYINAAIIHSKMTSKTSTITELLLSMNTIIVLCIGSLKIFYGNMEIGVLISLVQYVGMFFSSVSSVLRMLLEMQSEKKSIINVIEELKARDEKNIEGESYVKRNINKLFLDNISFSYVKNKNILYNASAEFDIGKMNYIIGKSGVGKSTILKLILQEYELNSGKIYAVDEDEKIINDVVQNISLVPQENVFYTDTIYNNITLSQDVSQEVVDNICKKCCVYEDIMQMERGFDTILSSGIKNISGGQLKRMALARAVISDRKILLLDEPTEGLDKSNAISVVSAIRNYAEKRIIIIITHNMELIQQGDNVYCIADSKLMSGFARKSFRYSVTDKL